MIGNQSGYQGYAGTRLDALTGLRWLAALMVFFFHLRVFSPLPGFISNIFDQGYLGVTFFFVLSGFVLTWSQNREISKSTFYWRRFARIYPATIVALLFAIPVFYDLGIGGYSDFFELKAVTPTLLLSFVLLQGWWANPLIFFSGNPAAWTLTFEMFFYACHPFIFKLVKNVERVGLFFLVISLLAWMVFFRFLVMNYPESFLTQIPGPVARITEFIFGMLLAFLIKSKIKPRIPVSLGILSVVVVVVLIVLSGNWGITAVFSQYNNELFTLAVGILIYSVATSQLDGKHTFLSSQLLVKLGEISFAFYLIHATVIYLALRIFGYQPASWANLGWISAIFIIDLVLAILLYTIIEKPLERQMRIWKDNRDRKINLSNPVVN